MKTIKATLVLTLLAFIFLFLAFKTASYSVQDGDIVFQTSKGELGKAIQVATASDYSHVGIVFYEKGIPMVYEAVQPVQAIPLSAWIKHGKNDHFVVKRLAGVDSVLTEEVKMQMLALGKQWLGKNYDIKFHWSDQDLYCSELVWKLYERVAGIEIGELAPLKSYHVDDELVKQRLEMHYGNNIPWEQEMITPQAMFDSPLLVTVPQKQQKKFSSISKR